MTAIRKRERWTEEEEQRLYRQVKAFPQNMSKCFMIVAEETGRSCTAVASHWYTVTSRRPDVIAFGMVSRHYVAKNRKNGAGVPITNSIWRRFLNIFRSI